MLQKKKSIELDSLLLSKQNSQKKPPSSNIFSVKSKLKGFAIEECKKQNNEEFQPSFLDEDEENKAIIYSDIEKNIYTWLEENNIQVANPKERIYGFFQKNKEKVMHLHKNKHSLDFSETKTETKNFLNFNNSPLIMRRDKKNLFSFNSEKKE